MMEFLDDDESIVMSLGKEKAKSRMAKLGMSEVQVYQLRSDARKNNDAVKKGIASKLSDKPAPAVTAGSSPESREKKTRKSKVKAPSYEEITSSFVSGVPDNSKVKRGSANKPVEQDMEIALVWNQKAKVPATVFGNVAVHRPVADPTGDEYRISEVSTGISMGGVFPKEQAEKLARRLGRLDWTNNGTAKRPQYPDETTKKAMSILGL